MARILRDIGKIYQAAKGIINTPDSHKDGDDFENYVSSWMFPEASYKLVHRTHDYTRNNERFSEDTLLPDFRFRCDQTAREFYVECKFRRPDLNVFEWCKKWQLERYKKVSLDLPVYVALGLQGSPKYPEYVYLFPLTEKISHVFRADKMDKYAFYVDRPVFSRYLWSLK